MTLEDNIYNLKPIQHETDQKIDKSETELPLAQNELSYSNYVEHALQLSREYTLTKIGKSNQRSLQEIQNEIEVYKNLIDQVSSLILSQRKLQ